MPASGGKATMIISGLTTRRLWIGGLFIAVYLAAAITLFFMISERVSALGSRSLANIVWTGAKLQTEYFLLRHAVENEPIMASDEAASTIDSRYEIVLNRLSVMQQGIIRESYSRQPESLALFDEIRGRLLGIEPYIAAMKLGNFGSRPQIEYTLQSLERPVAVFSSDIVNLVDANLREYDLGIANQTRFLALLLLGQILTAILFFVVLTRQVSRLRLAQDALIAANENLRRGEGAIRQSEAELTMARQRLLDGIEAIPDGFALYDSEDRLVICNSVMKGRFSPDDDTIAPGRTFEEILRRRLAAGRLSSPGGSEEAWVLERLREHHSGTIAREMRMHGDRTYRILERRTIDGGIVTIVSDISELKERQQRLRESQEILRSVLDSVPVVVTMTDASRRLLLLNRAAERRYNLRSIDVIGRDFAEVVPAPDQMPDLVRNHARLVESGQPQIGSVHHVATAEGDETWIVNRVPVLNDAGRVKYVIRTAYEVPQLAHAYHALDESRTRLMDAVNRARLTYWIGAEDGRSSIIGPGATRTLGFDADTLHLTDEEYLSHVHEAD